MRNYEVTFIVDPVLSGDEIKKTAQAYSDLLTNEGCSITNTDAMGLRQLAYPVNKKSSGIYYTIEFQSEKGSLIPVMELALRRDERIMRFLTISLDKYGVKYNEDKRAGKIGKSKKTVEREKDKEKKAAISEVAPKTSKPVKSDIKPAGSFSTKPAPAAAAAVAAPVEAAAPVEVKEAVPVKEVAKEAEVKAAAPVAAASGSSEDLTKIEGIGPKTAEALVAAGINTYSALSTADYKTIKDVLAAGTNLAHLDPATWGSQAKLAAAGQWDTLKKWQDELDNGKSVRGTSEEE